MPAQVEVLSINPQYQSSQVIFPGYIWHFPLEDPIANENRLLVYRCHPTDRHASFYKTGQIDKLPQPEDLHEIVRMCTLDAKVMEVQNGLEIPLDSFLDKEIGEFTIRLAHTSSMTRN